MITGIIKIKKQYINNFVEVYICEIALIALVCIFFKLNDMVEGKIRRHLILSPEMRKFF